MINTTEPNNTVFITGGASGIGLAAARKFAEKGFNICLVDRDAQALERTKCDLNRVTENLFVITSDITRPEKISDAMDRCAERFGQINVVLPSAGIVRDGMFIKKDRDTGKVAKYMSNSQFKEVVDVNLIGTFNTLQQAAIRMVDNSWTGLLFVVSSINQAGQLGQLNYCSTKHALAQWPKILVGEFHQQNIDHIRVVGISPGYVATPILNSIRTEVQEQIISGIALGRFLRTEEITSTLWHVWENQAINATTLEVSGGVIQNGVCK